MSNRSIIESIMNITGLNKVDQVYYANCIVDSVNIEERTCDCTLIDGNTGSSLPNVFLMAGVDDGLLIEPVIGSAVRVIFSQNVEPFVCQFSEIENVTIFANTKIKLNGDSFGGLVKVQDLTNKINALENLINSILTILKTTTIPLAPTGTYPFAPLYAALTNISPITVKSDLENTTVEHGS